MLGETLGLRGDLKDIVFPFGHNNPTDHAYREQSYSSQAQHVAYVIMP